MNGETPASLPHTASGLTGGLVLHAVPIPAHVAAGADAAVAALRVLTHLLCPRAHRFLSAGALIHIWEEGRDLAGMRLGMASGEGAELPPARRTHSPRHLAPSRQ